VKWNLEFSISRERIIDSISLPQIHKENGLVTIDKSIVILVPRVTEMLRNLPISRKKKRGTQESTRPLPSEPPLNVIDTNGGPVMRADYP
jgi:hypothetical protein